MVLTVSRESATSVSEEKRRRRAGPEAEEEMSVVALFQSKPKANPKYDPAVISSRMGEIQNRVVEIDKHIASLQAERRVLIRENQKLIPHRLKILIAAGLLAGGMTAALATLSIGTKGVNYAHNSTTLILRELQKLTHDNEGVHVVIRVAPEQGGGVNT